jgi:hypothetical protein
MKKRENKTKQKTEWFGSMATVTIRKQAGKTGV